MQILLTLLLLCCTSLCSAETLHGIVTYVYDGDTIMLQADKHYYRIRLASIDAPELDQPYGLEAKRALSKLVYNKPVIAQVMDKDIYGRKVAKVYAPLTVATKASDPLVDAQRTTSAKASDPLAAPVAEANNYMLAKGLAWHYSAFDLFDNEFEKHMKLENYARDNKLGLWKQEKPTPPWLWRKR